MSEFRDSWTLPLTVLTWTVNSRKLHCEDYPLLRPVLDKEPYLPGLNCAFLSFLHKVALWLEAHRLTVQNLVLKTTVRQSQ